MHKIILPFVFLILSAACLKAQENTGSQGAAMCSHLKTESSNLIVKSFNSAGSPRHAFDVLNYAINIDLVNCMINPYPKSFAADVKILFRVDSTLSQVILDADNTSLTIDSVSSAAISYTHSGDKLSVQLDRTYIPGEQAEVHIYYKHADIADGAFYASAGFVFTDCEPEGARKWFPCYDKPSDKATTDITAIVPSNARMGSNGRLQDSIIIANTIKYHWVSRDPLATYLAVLTARNNYKLDIVNWTNPNTAEVIPFRFYYNPGENPSVIESMIGNIATFYSQEYGDHPFEKNGFATLNSEFAWGGMENQSLTSLCPNCWDEYYIAHEFAHQWFGDMVTCATWADIFLNEGFATWSEAHWTENQHGYAAYKNEVQGNANTYFAGNPQWAISSPAWAVTTPGVDVLFNYAITYMKGSCVMHMLRYTLVDDVFFPALKAYATDTANFKYKSATIEDFKNKMSAESGQNLDWFFDEWIYKPNHPIYSNVYGFYPENDGKWQVLFTARQEDQPFLPYFQMPIELRISFTNGTDSTIRVFNSFNNQVFSFEFNKVPSQLVFDPNNDILLKGGTTILGIDDNAAGAKGLVLKISPDPFINQAQFSFNLEKPAFVSAELYSNTGVKTRKIMEQYLAMGEHTTTLSGEGLKAGTYFIVLRADNTSKTLKIIKTE
ncbi:MAG: M1 family aminopeptidase [Bacteroidota bacterium]